MKYIKQLTFILALMSLKTTLPLAYCQSEPLEKTAVLKKVAGYWLDIGIEQYQRGMYIKAEESFLKARDYSDFLNEKQKNNLEQYAEKTHKAYLGTTYISEKAEQCRRLLDANNLPEARQIIDEINKNKYLTALQKLRFKINQLETRLNSKIQKQQEKLKALLETSIQDYRAGRLQTAENGLAKINRNALSTASQKQTADGYLKRIKNLLEKENEPFTNAEKMLLAQPPKEQNLPLQKTSLQKPTTPQIKTTAPKPAAPAVKKTRPPSVTKEQTIEKLTKKEKILRSYSQAVINDATEKAKSFIEKGELYKAKQALRKAGTTIHENKSYLSDELYQEYMQQLIELGQQIQQK